MLDTCLAELADYGVRTGLIEEADRTWAVNRLLEALGLTAFTEPEALPQPPRPLEDILRDILDGAEANGRIEGGVVSRDLLDTELMGRLTPRPSQVLAAFRERYAQSPESATDWYYRFSQDTDYIRRYRIARDVKWVTPTEFGDLDITINLSKPEKDPKAIAAAKLAPRPATPSAPSAGRTRATWAAPTRPPGATTGSSPWSWAGSPGSCNTPPMSTTTSTALSSMASTCL